MHDCSQIELHDLLGMWNPKRKTKSQLLPSWSVPLRNDTMVASFQGTISHCSLSTLLLFVVFTVRVSLIGYLMLWPISQPNSVGRGSWLIAEGRTELGWVFWRTSAESRELQIEKEQETSSRLSEKVVFSVPHGDLQGQGVHMHWWSFCDWNTLPV